MTEIRTDELPMVSVVVPAYNAGAHLRRCLEALERQSYRQDRYEVLVVDNGSASSPEAVLDGLPHARLTTVEKTGSYAARNHGIDLTGGDIVAFTDADCQPHPRWLERGVAALEDHPQAAVGGRMIMTASRNGGLGALELHEVLSAFDQRDFVERQHFSATANLMTWRSVLAEVGAFDDSLLSAGDVEWGRRLQRAGKPLIYVDDLKVRHPARRSLREVVVKQRRKIGGHYSVRPLLGTAPQLAWRNITSPFRALRARREDPLLTSLRNRVKFFAADALVGFIRNLELIRLLLGGAPTRG